MPNKNNLTAALQNLARERAELERTTRYNRYRTRKVSVASITLGVFWLLVLGCSVFLAVNIYAQQPIAKATTQLAVYNGPTITRYGVTTIQDAIHDIFSKERTRIESVQQDLADAYRQIFILSVAIAALAALCTMFQIDRIRKEGRAVSLVEPEDSLETEPEESGDDYRQKSA